MARRLESLDLPLPPGLRGQFCKRFRALVKASSVGEVAEKSGLSATFLRRIVAGDRVPDIDTWPELAKRLGLKHWTEFFDAPRVRKGASDGLA